jgi:nicotinamide mononucleotide transporter
MKWPFSPLHVPEYSTRGYKADILDYRFMASGDTFNDGETFLFRRRGDVSRMSPLEVIAFIVSVAGVWLTTARSLWNYPFSLLSVALYGLIFFQVKLYADMALQGIFALTLLYGLAEWLRGRSASGEVVVTRIRLTEFLASLLLGAALALGLGHTLETHTDASLPWADSVLLAGSLIGSIWAARRRLENWWVWIIVDVLYVGLYLLKHLYLTAVLYAAFVILAVLGLRRWRAAFEGQPIPGAGRS